MRVCVTLPASDGATTLITSSSSTGCMSSISAMSSSMRSFTRRLTYSVRSSGSRASTRSAGGHRGGVSLTVSMPRFRARYACCLALRFARESTTHGATGAGVVSSSISELQVRGEGCTETQTQKTGNHEGGEHELGHHGHGEKKKEGPCIGHRNTVARTPPVRCRLFSWVPLSEELLDEADPFGPRRWARAAAAGVLAAAGTCLSGLNSGHQPLILESTVWGHFPPTSIMMPLPGPSVVSFACHLTNSVAFRQSGRSEHHSSKQASRSLRLAMRVTRQWLRF